MIRSSGFRGSALQIQSTIVDFTTIGGAIGTYGTGIYFTNTDCIYGMSLNVFRNFTSAGAADVSIGYRSINTVVPYSTFSNTEFANAVPFAGLVVGPSLTTLQTFMAQTAIGTINWELTFTIGTAPLTDFNTFISLTYFQLEV